LDPFKAAVDAGFNHHGLPAILDPDGAARPVRLLPHNEDDFVEFGQTGISHESGGFEIRGEDLAGFGPGSVLEVSGVRRKIQSVKVKDPRRYKSVLGTVAM
jgi:hypothetical protein